uniref:Uncharacterized protein n=1 Tax=Anguilla anguilla TaxID=7936 RepID=A0A0E9S5Y3_ANGAN
MQFIYHFRDVKYGQSFSSFLNRRLNRLNVFNENKQAKQKRIQFLKLRTGK